MPNLTLDEIEDAEGLAAEIEAICLVRGSSLDVVGISVLTVLLVDLIKRNREQVEELQTLKTQVARLTSRW